MRRRSRSSFSSPSDGMGTVRWLQPAGIQRRRRRRPPVVPILLLIVRARRRGRHRLRAAGARGREPTAARRPSSASRPPGRSATTPRCGALISPERRRDWPLAEFASSYRIAAEQATVKSVQVRAGAEPVDGSRAGARARAHARLRACCAAPCRCGSSSATASPTWTGRRPGACPACATARTSAARCSSAPRGARSWPPTAAAWRPSRRRPRSSAPRPRAASPARACRRSTTSGSAAAPAPSCASASG